MNRLHWFHSYNSIKLISIWIIKRIEFHYLFRIPFNYLDSNVLPFTFHVEDDERRPNYVPMKIIGLVQNSHEILKDGDIPILTVVLITTDYLQFNCYRTGILLYILWAEVNKICIRPYVYYHHIKSSPNLDVYDHHTDIICRLFWPFKGN